MGRSLSTRLVNDMVSKNITKIVFKMDLTF